MSRRPTLTEQLHDYAVTRDVAADARSTREEFRRLDQRVADLESLLHDVDACLEWVWPHFGGDQADKIAALQKRVIDAVSN